MGTAGYQELRKRDMDAKQEHNDFLRKTSNEVHELVRNQTIMTHFRNQVRLFCEKNEEHEAEVKQLRRAYEADSELRAAVDRLEKEQWGLSLNQMTKEEKASIDPREYPKGPPEGYEGFVNYGGFWGPPANTADLWYYLSTPIEREYMDMEGEWETWRLKTSRSSDAEKLISCYALLAAIHDHEIPEKPIYTHTVYNGSWQLRDECVRRLSLKCRDYSYPWEQDSHEGGKDVRAWIARAYDDVIDNLKRISLKRTKDDLNKELLRQIRDDIRKHPYRYREAGKWLDEYCSVENFWLLKEALLKHYLATKATLETQVTELPDFEVLRKRTELTIEYLRQILKLRIYVSEEYAMKAWFEDGEISKQAVTVWVSRQQEYFSRIGGVSLYFRLAEAQRILLTFEPIMPVDRAKRICLVTWLMTDPDTDKAKLGLTNLESWNWEYEDEMVGGNGRKSFPERDSSKKWDAWLECARNAWAKVEAEKEYETSSSGNSSKNGGTEITPDDIDKKIIELYQEGQEQGIKMPGNQKIATALYNAHITQKELSREAIRKRVKRLRQEGLIGSPDDGKDTAKRCTNRQIEDLDGTGQTRQKF